MVRDRRVVRRRVDSIGRCIRRARYVPDMIAGIAYPHKMGRRLRVSLTAAGYVVVEVFRRAA